MKLPYVYDNKPNSLYSEMFQTDVTENIKIQMMSKRPTNTSLIQCIGAQHTPTCFGISKCHHQGVRYEHAEILSANTLNEWCICWSFTHHKKIHGPNCKIKIHILCEVTFFRKPCRLLDNMTKCSTIPQVTHSEYVMLIIFQLQQWLHERTSLLRYILTDWSWGGPSRCDTYICCLFF
jgi:hypothetical protein